MDAVFQVHKCQDTYEEMLLTPPLRLAKIKQDLSPEVILENVLHRINL